MSGKPPSLPPQGSRFDWSHSNLCLGGKKPQQFDWLLCAFKSGISANPRKGSESWHLQDRGNFLKICWIPLLGLSMGLHNVLAISVWLYADQCVSASQCELAAFPRSCEGTLKRNLSNMRKVLEFSHPQESDAFFRLSNSASKYHQKGKQRVSTFSVCGDLFETTWAGKMVAVLMASKGT